MVEPRIHIVGSSPRSGTTLLFEMFCAGFDVERFGDHEVSVFDDLPSASKPYVSKRPMDLVHVRRLVRWDSSLHVIYVERDPRDVVASRHGARAGEYWCDFSLWARNNKLLGGLGEHSRVHVCRYEDLVDRPDDVQQELQRAFPFLVPTHSFSEFHRVAEVPDSAMNALGGVRPVSSSSVGRWREDLPRVAAQLVLHPQLAEAVVRAGYEPDISWVAECAGIAPGDGSSVRTRNADVPNASGFRRAVGRVQRRVRTLRCEVLYVAGCRRVNGSWRATRIPGRGFGKLEL